MKNIIINPDTYDIITDKHLEDLKSRGMLLRHKKSGARISLILNDDENKVFYIAFRTPPHDSTGAAHILEHCVLCGSERFPTKDPFIEMLKGSLNTFLNAMTYPDKTVYPVASLNDKDFHNLMHVYLDAVFFPNIYKEEKIFMQEGWHYEVDEDDGSLCLNGVVYNEMKGAFSTPDDVVEREVMAGLFPDGTYGHESGGNPEDIPQLSYQAFLDFHKRYYHPSNSFIYLYGDMDVAERLDFLDKEYLSRFEQAEIESGIKIQAVFNEPRHICKKYPVLEAADAGEGAYLSYNIAMDIGVDPCLYLAFQILDYALCQAPGAVLKQALLDAHMGKEVYSSLQMGLAQPYYSIVAKDADAGREDEFVEIILSLLSHHMEHGLDKKALAAGLNYYEFRYREADFGSYPKGLIFGLQALDSWLYDENGPFSYLEMSGIFSKLRKAIDKGYFEQLIRTYLFDNPHKCIMKVLPEVGLSAKQEAKLKQSLAGIKKEMSAAAFAAVQESAEALVLFQQAEDAPEDIEKIPMLSRADIKTAATPFVYEERKAGSTPLLFHDIESGGIGYLRFIFDITQISADLFPYLGILQMALAMVDTKHYAYADLVSEINIHTGGIQTGIATYADLAGIKAGQAHPAPKASLELKVKFLYDKMDKAFELSSEILLNSLFDDKKRLYEIIAEQKSKMETAMTSGGHGVAVMRALSYFSAAATIGDQTGGLSQYRLLAEMEANFDEKFDDLSHKLTTLATYLFRQQHLLVDYLAGEGGYQDVEDKICEFSKALFTGPMEGGKYAFEAKVKNEGFMTAGAVQFAARAGNFLSKDLPYTGALRALRALMGLEYLWMNIRVTGGAYGCMCNFTRSGEAYFVSYRDPHLSRTLGVYAEAAAYIRELEADERQITQLVLGAVGDLDVPMTPAMKGAYALSAYMSGITFADVQRERDELLGVDLETLRGLWHYVEAFISQDILCVVGSEEKIKEGADLFMNIAPLLA